MQALKASSSLIAAQPKAAARQKAPRTAVVVAQIREDTVPQRIAAAALASLLFTAQAAPALAASQGELLDQLLAQQQNAQIIRGPKVSEVVKASEVKKIVSLSSAPATKAAPSLFKKDAPSTKPAAINPLAAKKMAAEAKKAAGAPAPAPAKKLTLLKKTEPRKAASAPSSSTFKLNGGVSKGTIGVAPPGVELPVPKGAKPSPAAAPAPPVAAKPAPIKPVARAPVNPLAAKKQRDTSTKAAAAAAAAGAAAAAIAVSQEAPAPAPPAAFTAPAPQPAVVAPAGASRPAAAPAFVFDGTAQAGAVVAAEVIGLAVASSVAGSVTGGVKKAGSRA